MVEKIKTQCVCGTKIYNLHCTQLMYFNLFGQIFTDILIFALL